VRDRLKELFIDLGERELKNIVRPMRAYAIKTGSAGPVTATHVSWREKSSAPRLSIVVLPFANLGGDPEQEYFVDGVSGNSASQSGAQPLAHKLHYRRGWPS
jgi:hypothetical protein